MDLGFLRRLLRYVLALLVKAALKKHRPLIVFVKGNKNTAIIGEFLYKVTLGKYNTRQSLERADSEFSIPLTILGQLYYPRNYFEWVFTVVRSFLQVLWANPYKHLLVIQIKEITPDIYRFWQKVVKPALIVDAADFTFGEIRCIQDQKIPEKIEKILSHLKISTKEALEKLSEGIISPHSRLDIHKSLNHGILIDARYYYYPPALQSVIETISLFENDKYVLTDSRLSDTEKKMLSQAEIKILKKLDLEELKQKPYTIAVISSRKNFQQEIDLLRERI